MLKKSFLKKVFILIIFLLCLGVSAFTFYYQKTEMNSLPAQQTSKQPDQLSVLSGMIYRHLIGYNLVCSEAGYPLQKYPNHFGQKYTHQINQIDLHWHQYNTSLTDVLTRFDVQIYPTISKDIQEELIDLERVVAKNILARQNNIPVSQIPWNNELENQMNLKDACILLDDGAAFLLEKSSFDAEFKKRLNEITQASLSR